MVVSGHTVVAMSSKTRIEDLIAQAEAQEPEEGLAALGGLRARLEALEAAQVEKAVRAGWSWRRIAEVMGVTKQAAHKKHARRVAEKLAADGASERKRLIVTGLARQSVRHAREEAEALGEAELRPEHLLLGLLRDEGGRAASALAAAGVTLEAARAGASGLRMTEKRRAGKKLQPGERLPVSPDARSAMEESLREAVRRGDDHLGVEHLLLAIIHDEAGPALRLLEGLGVGADEVERLVDEAE